MAMNWKDVMRAWGKTLSGGRPSLSIEITRECPLRCTGCYAYEDDHVGAGLNLRQLQDKKGEALVNGIIQIVDEYRPLHLSLVGGDPLVRFRELCVLLPLLARRGIHVQVVTSAFREIPKEWADIPRLNLVVSIDGLQPEHDIRRRPATYDRILKNITGHHISIHCTITGQMMKRKGYLEDFLAFWTPRSEIKRVWFSIFTPQKAATDPEILSPGERVQTVNELLRLRTLYAKLDMNELVIKEFLKPPASPEECIFAQTTHTVSADLKTKIVPCQFGGQPDCSQCGCLASMGLAAVGHHPIGMGMTAGDVYRISAAVGKAVGRGKGAA
ncbi:MAG TPA: radical SAM protein [Candidatus Angelobacter sp.]|nr:radical SAM protein [Candidatus Angelobacter sp.]